MVRLLIFLAIAVLGSGFQFNTLLKWNISKDEYPVLWIKVDADFLDTSFDEFDLESSSGQTPAAAPDQMISILRDIAADYNSIATSFLRLQLQPVAGFDFGPADPDDIAFDESEAEKRTITITYGSSSTSLASGTAQPLYDEENVIGCKINIRKGVTDSARWMRGLLAHEIGHCLGLEHNHAASSSIMSYNHPDSQYELGVDDRMGITFLYPMEESYARESATLGLSCSRAK